MSEAQRAAYDKLKTLFGLEHVEFIISQGPEVLHARLEAFMRYEASLIGQVQDHLAASMPTRYISVPDSEPRARPLTVNVKTFEGKEGENLPFWIKQMEMSIDSALFLTERQKVAMAISKLGGRAMEWALSCSTSINDAFPSWDSLKQQMTSMFAPPDQAFRMRARLLATRQGKRTLGDFVQELRTLIASMHQDPVQEAIVVTIFMGGLNEGVARTELFRSHPATFEEAVAIALRAEFDFKSARVSTPVYRTSSSSTWVPSNRAEPMDLSLVEEGEEALQAVEQHKTIRRCYMCGSTKHLRPACPLRNSRKARKSSNSDLYQRSGTVRENVDTQ